MLSHDKILAELSALKSEAEKLRLEIETGAAGLNVKDRVSRIEIATWDLKAAAGIWPAGAPAE